MADLTTTNQPLAKTASSECTPELWRRLTDSRLDFQSAVDGLLTDSIELPRVRQEVIAAAGKLQRHVQPCGPKAVMAALMPLVTLYGVADRSEREWTAFWAHYLTALEGLPTEALKAGVEDYVALPDSEFFPRPGPLKALCEKRAIPIRMAMSRARKAAERLS